MNNKELKCIKGKSCLYCGSNYCRFVDELDQFKEENKELREVIKDIANLLDLDTGEEYNYGNIETEINQLKEENEILEKVNKANQEKIKKLNEQFEEEFIARQYGDEALFFEMTDYKQALQEIKEIANKNDFCPYYISRLCIKNKCKKKEDCVISKILQKCEVLYDNQ